MPRSLVEMFDRMMGKISDRNRQHARDILTWLVYAQSHLCVDDVQWILAFTRRGSSELVVDPTKRMQNAAEEIFAKCSSFVKLVFRPHPVRGQSEDRIIEQLSEVHGQLRESKVYVELAHSTIKEYLVSIERDQSATTWLRTLWPEPSHEYIAQALLAYLSHLGDFDKLYLPTYCTGSYDTLRRYAKSFWRHHARLSGTKTPWYDSRSPLHRQLLQLIKYDETMVYFASATLLEMRIIEDVRCELTIIPPEDAASLSKYVRPIWTRMINNSWTLDAADQRMIYNLIARSWKENQEKRLETLRIGEDKYLCRCSNRPRFKATLHHPNQPPCPPSNPP
jgi:hypothetical protein